MVPHVRFESLYISLPSSAKEQRKMTKSIFRVFSSFWIERCHYLFSLSKFLNRYAYWTDLHSSDIGGEKINTLLEGVVLGVAVVIAKTPYFYSFEVYWCRWLVFFVLLGNLREIMDEQLALELSRNVSVSKCLCPRVSFWICGHWFGKKQKLTSNKVIIPTLCYKVPDANTQDIATKLKRKKLYEMYPGIDPVALEEVFQANRWVACGQSPGYCTENSANSAQSANDEARNVEERICHIFCAIAREPVKSSLLMF